EQVEQAGLPHGSSFDLDFHSVPANSAQEPLEKHYVSSRSRSQKGILVFLARDAEQRVLRYANAGVTKGEQADEILQFVRFWGKHTGNVPAELVFDSQLTTYQKLSELNREGISFITLRRRSEKMLREIYSQPDSAWQRISLPALTRIYRNPKVLENRVTLPGYEGELRQLTVMELGHEEPTVLLTNHRKPGSVELVTRYAQRMLIENGISEAVQFFHIDALSSMVGMKVDFDMQLTLAATSLYRMMAQRIGREYSHSQAKTVFRNLLDLSGKVEVTATSVVVTLDKRAHNPYLVASGLADQPTGMPWFGDKKLIIQFARAVISPPNTPFPLTELLRGEIEARPYSRQQAAGGADPLVRGRRPGRPSRTRPSILTGFPYQLCPHRILFDIVPDLLELPLMPCQVVIALFLPKGLSRQCQHRVGPLGRDAFQRFRQFGQCHGWSSQ